MQKKQVLLMKSIGGKSETYNTITVGYHDNTDGAFHPIKKIGIDEEGNAFNYRFVANVFYNISAFADYSIEKLFNIYDSSEYNNYRNSFSLNFPNLTSIGLFALENAFYGCTGLTSVSFPELTSVDGWGLEYAFSGCTGLTSVSFPKLSIIDMYTLENAFYGCTGLTSVSFPKLTSIGSSALERIFGNCTKLKEVHFNYSLEGNSQCSISFMGSGASIYFDLGRAKYTITNIDTTATYIFNGEKIDTSTVSYGYVISNKANTILAYKPNYCLYIENLTPTDETPIEKAINFTTDGATYSITINGVSGVTPSTTFSYNGYEITTIEGTNPSIIVPEGTEISYVVKAEGYRTIRGTLNSSSSSQTFTMEVQTNVTYDLSYPFTDYPEVLTNLVDGSNFEIAETPTVYSGSGIQSSIINGSKSFNVNNGVSYGYIKFHTPDTTDTDLLTVSITCTAYTESATYDCAFAFVNTQLNTITTRTGSIAQGTNSTYGYVLYSNKSYNGSTYKTYTYTLQAKTDYYLQFAYTKDSSSHSGWDRFSITNIKFTDEGTY